MFELIEKTKKNFISLPTMDSSFELFTTYIQKRGRKGSLIGNS